MLLTEPSVNYVLIHCHEKDPRSYREQKYFVSTVISCLDHNGRPIRAKIGENCFYIYEEGAHEKCIRSGVLPFLGFGGEKYAAKIKDDGFFIRRKEDMDAPAGDFEPVTEEELYSSIAYLDGNRRLTVTSIAKWETN